MPRRVLHRAVISNLPSVPALVNRVAVRHPVPERPLKFNTNTGVEYSAPHLGICGSFHPSAFGPCAARMPPPVPSGSPAELYCHSSMPSNPRGGVVTQSQRLKWSQVEESAGAAATSSAVPAAIDAVRQQLGSRQRSLRPGPGQRAIVRRHAA